GNLADRLFIGYVRDFISFKFGNYYFPTFNIADMAIVIGVILLIISTIKEELSKRGSKSSRKSKRKTR
nr:signal peptidase II [Bacilli bacterium]